ncbi:unnamed protein product [Linum tenue]|uniref:Cytochrome P450 n=1 Tax=Linum tenue TaxID=586396 RepID=A0AAV0JHS0_9ROSI|nr:unnamed protein product [Linum tenue]CAI0409482.1 unnamed protein product [Linum tenue]CAI0409493.1 unnamed protein product [Linum tenue]
MDLYLFLSCSLCLIFTATFLHLLGRSKTSDRAPAGKLPPGPTRVPIIGNLHNLGPNPHKSLADLAKVHGPLMSLKLGRVTTIVASSPAMAKEILQKHDKVLSNRHVNLAMEALDHHKFSLPLLPVESKYWRNLRKVCNSYIFTAQRLDSNEELRRVKVAELVEGVRRNASGEAIDVARVAFRATLNAMSSTILSMDLADEERSEAAREFKELARGIMEDCATPNLGDFFPLLARMDLQGIKRRVKGIYQDLFVAGTDTTSTTLEWAMAELLRNPNALAKAREELDATIGKGNNFQESDVSRLPYLQAILKETFRLHPAAPLLLPRKGGEDVEICGFIMPKGVQILVNVWAIGRDPMIWDDPNAFVPERFLGSEVSAKGNNFELLPFGAGRRICPGLPLALRILHMMLGSLIHWFDWKLPDGVEPEKLDMDEKFGMALQKAKPLLAIPTPR